VSRFLSKDLFRVVVFVVLLLFVAPTLEAVLVAPHAIFIDHRTRTAQLTLANPGDEPEEIQIDLVYGYPVADSAGRPYVRLIENPDASAPSAAGWIRAFPRRLRLEPGQRQVIRLLASPPADLPDGEAWTRLIVTSRRAQELPLGADTALRAGLTLEMRTIISVTYRKGETRTGVRLEDVHGSVEGDSLVSWVGLQRTGNAAFLGTARFTMYDSGDEVVGEWSVPIAVYYDLTRRFSFALDSLPAGEYRVRFDLTTERSDLPQSSILPAEPVSGSFGVVVR